MSFSPLSHDDRITLARADSSPVVNALASLGNRSVPPWLNPGHPYPTGALPTAPAQFAALAPSDLIETIAARSPLHALDGWGYLGRAINSLISGDPHASRHLGYYAELRAALSILASSGIGIFNRQNVVVDAAGSIHSMAPRSTHDMCWAAIAHWATIGNSLETVISPISLGGASLNELLRAFFPGASTAAAGYLMQEWGFDLQQGANDKDERNSSSYQPTALLNLLTTPNGDAEFLTMFWEAMRPGSPILNKHLLRILLEVESLSLGDVSLHEREHRYTQMDDRARRLVPIGFLLREDDPVDHQFLIHAASRSDPAHPYSMICRAALLLQVATGISEACMVRAGIQPTTKFDNWWRQFGIDHGLWAPPYSPSASTELWEDVNIALEDLATAPVASRHQWVASMGGGAVRLCETERAGLWGLFR
ncbi:hypothetical protein [Rhizobium tumorigenes]|uniref:hypothetical protein n=1 Tax=Rhizobium tumorigenes TaxID=2041385 RepID=UPI00241C6F72|nr:hypothetical protein [Rhizobium tumorigenes]WFS03108.1 hypothetical protein PR016_20745 [Rhizobium tumorigenes]